MQQLGCQLRFPALLRLPGWQQSFMRYPLFSASSFNMCVRVDGADQGCGLLQGMHQPSCQPLSLPVVLFRPKATASVLQKVSQATQHASHVCYITSYGLLLPCPPAVAVSARAAIRHVTRLSLQAYIRLGPPGPLQLVYIKSGLCLFRVDLIGVPASIPVCVKMLPDQDRPSQEMWR